MNNYKVGDVIAFSGKGRVSQIIKWKTNSRYSHVGMIMDNANDAILIESTSLTTLADIKHGQLIKGVQAHKLARRLDTYNGQAWWLPLRWQPTDTAINKMQNWLSDKHNNHTKYDRLGALGAGADLFDWIPGLENEEDFSSLFCSELVTKALQIVGVVSNYINPSEQTPADVACFACLADAINLK